MQQARGSLRPALRSLVAKAPTSSLAATVAASASAASAFTFWIQRNRARRENSALLRDPVTELPRREIFEDRLTLGLGRAERSKRPIAVGMCDVNNFKQINDSYGHAAGDDLLREVARRLRHDLRATDTVTRFGGDEFALIFEDLGDQSHAIELARRVAAKLWSEPFQVGRNKVSLAGSIGLTISDGSSDAETLVWEADSAMYQAKRAGRQLDVYDPELRAVIESRERTESQLLHGLRNDELRVFFQPVIDLERGYPVAMEALVRWQHPTRGLLPPAEFVPLAEANGTIVALGEWVLRSSLGQAAAWQQDGIDMVVTVNVSTRQLTEPDFADVVAGAREATGLEPGSLSLEVTETLLMESPAAEEALHRLRAAGALIALDDFGTGFSSLARLKDLPLDVLKIDSSFTAEVASSERHAGIVNTICQMARGLNLEVVGEGVETEAQQTALYAMGCVRQQGFRFARPMPAHEAKTWLTDRAPELIKSLQESSGERGDKAPVRGEEAGPT